MLCIQVGVLVSETFIFCDYWCFFSNSNHYFVASCLNIAKGSAGVTVSCSWVCWWRSCRVRAQNAPGRKVCRYVLSRGWQVLFFGAAGMQSSCRVWMCIWDYLIFLFKDPGERIQAGWSSPLSPVMHPPWRLIVWFCKMRLNRLNSAKVRHTDILSFCFLACKLLF